MTGFKNETFPYKYTHFKYILLSELSIFGCHCLYYPSPWCQKLTISFYKVSTLLGSCRIWWMQSLSSVTHILSNQRSAFNLNLLEEDRGKNNFCSLPFFSDLSIRRYEIKRESKDLLQDLNQQLPESKVEFLSSVPWFSVLDDGCKFSMTLESCRISHTNFTFLSFQHRRNDRCFFDAQVQWGNDSCSNQTCLYSTWWVLSQH